MELMKPCGHGMNNDGADCFYYSAVFESHTIGHIIIDTDMRIVAANTCMFKNFNFASSPIENRLFGNLFHCMALGSGMCCGQAPICEYCKLNHYLRSVFKHHLKAAPLHYRFMVDGEIREKYFNLSGHSLTYRGERYASLSFVDVTNIKQRERNLRRQLEYDFATGAHYAIPYITC